MPKSAAANRSKTSPRVITISMPARRAARRSRVQVEGVGQRDADQHVVRCDAGVEELEGAVLGGFDGDDVAGLAGQ